MEAHKFCNLMRALITSVLRSYTSCVRDQRDGAVSIRQHCLPLEIVNIYFACLNIYD